MSIKQSSDIYIQTKTTLEVGVWKSPDKVLYTFDEFLLLQNFAYIANGVSSELFAHVRADYPNRDDENWLKWIVITKGEDRKPAVNIEQIPFERYKFKPEGWTPGRVY